MDIHVFVVHCEMTEIRMSSVDYVYELTFTPTQEIHNHTKYVVFCFDERCMRQLYDGPLPVK